MTVRSRDVDLNESRQPEMLREMIPFVVLACVAVAMRFSVRKWFRIPYGADDYMIVAGLAVYAISLVYASAILTIKLSILLFYRRIFTTKNFILVTNLTGLVVIAWWIAVVFTQIFSCRPVHGFWNRAVEPTCIKPTPYYVGVAVPNIATDIVLLALPVRMILGLQLSTGQKIGLTATFLTGGFVVAASLIRIFKLLPTSTQTDLFWSWTDSGTWTSIEPSVGVICACLPTLRPMLRLFSSKLDDSIPLTGSTSRGTLQRSKTGRMETGRTDTQRTESEEDEERTKLPLQYPPSSGLGYKTRVVGLGEESGEKGIGGIEVRRDVFVEGRPRAI
ncbi:MAG: hypothetical protein LQ342_005108 [Letrouitia transgressa]|nr:MAG: hypothetical protein LQ342_005108 [Letrouitia transgressa]